MAPPVSKTQSAKSKQKNKEDEALERYYDSKFKFTGRTNRVKYFKPNPELSWRNISLESFRRRKWYKDAPVVVCFNSPRLSLRLRKLVGTEIFILNDENFVRKLKLAIIADEREQQRERIQKRIDAELERERRMILSGQQKDVPRELYGDKIIQSRMRVAIQREKIVKGLKTHRQKACEKLRKRAKTVNAVLAKAEDECMVREHDRRVREKEHAAVAMEYLEHERTADVASLLRIPKLDWRCCEQDMLDFLQYEHEQLAKQRARVKLVFVSDPRDMLNITQAPLRRNLKREEEMRELEDKRKQLQEQQRQEAVIKEEKELLASGNQERMRKWQALEDEVRKMREMEKEEERMLKKYDSNTAYESLSETDFRTVGKTGYKNADEAKAILEAEIDAAVQRGHMLTKEQYRRVHYIEEKIEMMKTMPNLCEFYQLAEQVIRGEQIRVSEVIFEEEETVEEEEVDDDDDDD